MRVLVTGGAGFIGSNLVRHLAGMANPPEVSVIDDLSTGSLDNLHGCCVEFVKGSILDSALLQRAVDGIDVIVHLAALASVPRSLANPMASHEANATGTLSVLEAARCAAVHQVIVASSSSVYGANPHMPKVEDDWTRPLSPYAVSKLATEGYALAYQASFGLPVLAFRFFNVYGPRQSPNHAYAAVIPKFLDAGLRGDVAEITGDGRQSRDFTYVGSVCAVIGEAIQRQVSSPTPVNLAFGTRLTLLELLELIESVLGRKMARRFVPERMGDVRESSASTSRLMSLFPGTHAVEIREGLIETANWLQGQLRSEDRG